MITKTKEYIIGYIKINKQARVSELVRVLKLSPVAIHKQLKKLLQTGVLQKIGTAPHVFYVLEEKKKNPF